MSQGESLLPARRIAGLAAFLLGCALILPAIAQVAPPGSQPFPDPLKPLPDAAREPARPGVVPPPPAADEKRRGLFSSGVRVFVSAFRFSGNSVFTEVQLGELVGAFTGREIGNAELEEVRHVLTRRYIAAGYVNSGAVIPDQEVSGGIINVRIVEGVLNEVTVVGDNGFHANFIRSRVAPGAGPPLNVNRLQEQIQLLLQNPQVARINAELGPGLRPGESALRLDVAEAKRFRIGYSVANNRSPAIGAVRSELSGSANNLLGWGDVTTLSAGRTRGLDDYAASFSIPVSAHDTLLSLRYEKNSATVIELPFSALDIGVKSDTFEIGLSHPFYRTLQQSLTLGASIAKRTSASTLLGQPFSFTPGLVDGKSVIAPLRLSADWLDRSAERVIAARFMLTVGLDALGATVGNGRFPDAKFVSGLAQLQWAQRLGGEMGQIVFRAARQFSNDSLLPAEKFAVGGIDSVRGYRESQMVRDNGWSGSAEYRVPVGRIAIPWLGDTPDDGTVNLVAFADAGRAWDDNGDGSVPKRIYGVGPGVRWDIAPGAFVHLYKGFPRQRFATSSHNLQDSGVHIRAAIQKAF